MSDFASYHYSKQSKFEFLFSTFKVRVTNIPSSSRLLLEHILEQKVKKTIFALENDIIEIDFNSRDAMLDLFTRLEIPSERYDYLLQDLHTLRFFVSNAPYSWQYTIVGMTEEKLVKLCSAIGHSGYQPTANHMYSQVHPDPNQHFTLPSSPPRLQRMHDTYNVEILADDADEMGKFIELVVNNSSEVLSGAKEQLSEADAYRLGIEVSGDSHIVCLDYTKPPSSFTFALYGMTQERLEKLCALIGHSGYMPVHNHLYFGSNHPVTDDVIPDAPIKLTRMNCHITERICFSDHSQMANMVHTILPQISYEEAYVLLQQLEGTDINQIKRFVLERYGVDVL